jgi:23S rRNA U2552 (ribose-2'-O)-methylase RlmE/FtsJ
MLTASTSPPLQFKQFRYRLRKQEPSLDVLNIDMERDINVSGFHSSSRLRCLYLAQYAMECAMEV